MRHKWKVRDRRLILKNVMISLRRLGTRELIISYSLKKKRDLVLRDLDKGSPHQPNQFIIIIIIIIVTLIYIVPFINPRSLNKETYKEKT